MIAGARAAKVPVAMRYAAYGSNLHPLRLAARSPSARLLGTAAVPGWHLAFNKRGADGSGKCSIGLGGPGVWVAVFSMDRPDAERLDGFEGAGYLRRELDVPGFGRCFTYLGEADWLDDALEPYDWYRDLVLAGARLHGFPREYVETIEAQACRRDEDRGRRERNASLLARIAEDARGRP